MNRVLKSLLKLLLVTIVSIVLFIVGIPLIVDIQKHGYGNIFSVTMISILIVAIIFDQLRKRSK